MKEGPGFLRALFLFGINAGSQPALGFGHRSLSSDELIARLPLTPASLRGGFVYFDAQVDDYALARTFVASAINEGAIVREQTPVTALRRDGNAWVVMTPTAVRLLQELRRQLHHPSRLEEVVDQPVTPAA